MSNLSAADSVSSSEVDTNITLYPSGHEPLLLTADESNAAALMAKALTAIEAFYGTLNKAQRARLDVLYGTPRVGADALMEVVHSAKAQVSRQLATLCGHDVQVDAVRIHTARSEKPDVSEPLWAWLARGTPVQLAQPRLTRDANDFVDNSWLTLGGGALTKLDGSQVTVDEIVSIGRELDIGASIATQCDAWLAQAEVASTIRRESSANFEIVLLNALKVGQITPAQHLQLQASAGVSLAGIVSYGLPIAGLTLHRGNFMLRVEGHDLPVYALSTASGVYVYAGLFPEGRLFVANAAQGFSAMQVFTEAFRRDLWGTRRERSGWSWSLLTPSAQRTVSARMPQPLASSTVFPAGAYWAHGAGVYVSKADYDRGASGVRFTAPYPLSQATVTGRLASAYGALLVGRVKEHFTPNQSSSLEHAQRIGAEVLAFVLDVLLIAVPGDVKFPGRALLFKAMFAKQLAIDLPQNLVQSKWDEAAETLVDFFETVLEMQLLRKAGTLVRSRLDKLNRTLLPGRTFPSADAGAGGLPSVTPVQRLRSMLPSTLQGLSDDAVATLLRHAGASKQALDAMWRGKAPMDMALAAAASAAISRELIGQTASLLATPHYTQLPEAVEWPVVGWLAQRLNARISVEDADGRSLRVFEPERGPAEGAGASRRDVVLTRHDRWHYGSGQKNGSGETADSLFFHVQAPTRPGQIVDNRSEVATRLRQDAANQFVRPQQAYLLQRAIHHDDRPRASVPKGEGALLAVSVEGNGNLPEGRLQGSDAGAVSAHSERCVAQPGSPANLAKARHQADLAALAGAPGLAGPQSFTFNAESLYLSALLRLFNQHDLHPRLAVRVMAAGKSVAAWGSEQASQVLVLQRRGDEGAYAYRGQLDGAETIAPANDSPAPVSDVLLRIMDDAARERLGINIGDAQALNRAVMGALLTDTLGAPAPTALKGVDLHADPELDTCLQAVTLHTAPGADGLTLEGNKTWLQWGPGALEVRQEGTSWRVQGRGATRGPLLHRSYGEWRRLQEPVEAVTQVVDGPVQGAAVQARLAALYARDPLARLYHDAVDNAGGGGSYIVFRGLSPTFYRVKSAEPGAVEVEVVRPAGTGGGVWLHRLQSGLWQLARTLPGGMENNADPQPWRPWSRPGAQQLPRTLGLSGSRHEGTFSLAGGTHKASNRFFPFVRPFNRRGEFDRLLANAPGAVQRSSDSANIAEKVELFHHQWQLPVDITALRFFRMPGEITSEAKHINGALIADLVTAQHAGQPLIRRVLEPMSGSGFYSNFIRATGFRGEIRLNDISPLVTLTQTEIVRQPDRVKHHINNIKQTLVELWQVNNHDVAFDPQTLKINFPNGDASRTFVNSAQVKRYRDDVRHYFYTTVETQYKLRDGDIVVSPDSSFLADPINGDTEARAYIAAAFYIMQNNSTRHRAPVQINEMGRLDLPMAIVTRDGNAGTVLLLANGLSNLDGLNYLSYLHSHEQGHTTLTRADGWEMLRVVGGESNLGDLAILSGHFSDVYLSEVEFMDKVREHVMPFVHNRGRVIITNAYSPFKERAYLELGLRVFVLENRAAGYLLVMNDAVARDAGLANA
ncbi:hypothetical protein PZ739_09375 [Pseudomonas kermanshahensis]|uniref:hypothetical protein n=1 Tax=Pseudomonas kermanshahensis TaxID=2745482 RepID=UPI0023DA64DC|nr:hypothetical protein [Pseudomonas kermanshahensis]WEL57346.1 hypothetical protein PZ739_09375 [Pseudomonas kermanshahensis]